MIDWVKHACPNVVRVDNVGDAVFVPYYYEDQMTERELGPVDMRSPILQEFAVVHRGGDHVVTQRMEPALIGIDSTGGWSAFGTSPARGVDPSSPDLNLGNYAYRIYVSQPAEEYEGDDLTPPYITFDGRLMSDTVYDGKDVRSDIKRILKGGGFAGKDDAWYKRAAARARQAIGTVKSKLDKDDTRIIFYPQIPKAQAESFETPGNLRIDLYMGVSTDKMVKIMHIRGGYDLTKKSRQSRLASTLEKAMQLRLKSKFKSVAGKHLLRAEGKGVSAIVTLELSKNENEAIVVDVELLVPVSLIKRKLYKANPTGVHANPDKVSAGKVKTALAAVDLSDSDSDDEAPPVPGYDPEQIFAPISTPFQCDPRSVESLQGLAMALEHALVVAHPATVGKDEYLQNVAGIIRKHARLVHDELGGEAPKDVPLEVNTAIHAATNALYDLSAQK
jgi:hypothetical protein